MNQSIPHLGAGLLGHVLGTAWRGYRVHFLENLRDRYEQDILPRACNNQDFLEGFFERRIEDAVRVKNPVFDYNLLNLLSVSDPTRSSEWPHAHFTGLFFIQVA